MCTVTYLPKGNNAFLFTSNRDEAPQRSSAGIQRTLTNGKTLLFPQDKTAKGTWIATSDTHQLVCILNGAFERHDRHPPYRLSRGIMALQFFDYEGVDDFLAHFNFEGIEPFTMIIYDNGRLIDLHWDEKSTNARELDINMPHIWSSCTLYTKEWQQKRETWFANWREKQATFELQNIVQFHKTAGENDPWNDIVMNRLGIVQTVSITAIQKLANLLGMTYHDLLQEENTTEQLKMKEEL